MSIAFANRITALEKLVENLLKEHLEVRDELKAIHTFIEKNTESKKAKK